MTPQEFDRLSKEAKMEIRSNLSELGKAACDYAEMGFSVFPLKTAGKEPDIPGGHNEATDDWEDCCWFWNEYPDRNVGIVTGDASGGLLVIDVDQDEDRGKYGDDSLKDWESENGKLPETVCATTGSGGTHYFYKTSLPLNCSTNQVLCIDRRCNGGYVVAPPSIHPSGGKYEWDINPWDDNIAYANDTVMELLAHCDGGNGTEAASGKAGHGNYQFPPIVNDGEGREYHLMTYAFSLRAQGWDYPDIHAELSRVNAERVIPPKPDTAITRISRSACKKPAGLSPAYQAAKDRAEKRDRERADEAYAEFLASEAAESDVESTERQADLAKCMGVAPRIIHLADHVGKPLPPLRPEIIDGIMRENTKMLVQGASKAGKTWLMIELSVAMSTGCEWLGWKCRQGKVLYVNFELQHESFMHRLAKVCDGMRVPMDEAMRNIDLWNLRGFSKSMAEMNDQHFFQTIKPGDYQLIILDPFYKLMEGSENDAEVVGEFVRQLEKLCVRLDVGVCYVHHYSKGLKGDVSPMDRSSGSGVFARDADVLVDVCELDTDDDPDFENVGCFRVSTVLRDFAPKKPFDVFFDDFHHFVDVDGSLEGKSIATASSKGGKASGLSRREKSATKASEFVDKSIEYLLEADRPLRLDDVKSVLGVKDTRTAKKYVESDGRLACWNEGGARGHVMVGFHGMAPE